MSNLDRNDPEVRAAADRAARAAEHILEAHNGEADQELALDVLNDFVHGFDHHRTFLSAPLRDRRQRLAWAFALTERRDDLAPFEAKLLDLAWEKVREDAVHAEWERMGR